MALKTAEAGGERFVISNGPCRWSEWRECSICSAVASSDASASTVLAAKQTGSAAVTDREVEDPSRGVYKDLFDASKASRILGLTYRTLVETAAFTLKSVEDWTASERETQQGRTAYRPT